jgi:serine/threonine protein kinase/tetratricopeptide (TPR) repeat protein
MIEGLDANQWRRAGELFHELVTLDPVERSERLSSMGTDPALRSAVEALLAGDAVADERLPQPGFGGLQASSSGDPLQLVGRTVSHFRVGEPLASGGMGVVYRAEDLQLRRSVALKFLLPHYHFTFSSKERFLREARAAGALDHPNLCVVHEVGESTAGLFIAMPLYDGETLKDRLARTGTIPAAEALGIASQIAAGLQHAHTAGILHRDIKPGNIMLLPGGTAKILDFGLAKVRTELTISNALLGTVSYMSPEQVQGDAIDGRTDLWALGVMLYEMLSGVRPFAADHEAGILHRILNANPYPLSELLPTVAPDVEALVVRLLEKNPGARYASANEVAGAIASIRTGSSAHSRPRAGRRRWIAPLTVAAVALVGVGASMAMRGPHDRGREFVVVADFETAPGDSAIADFLTVETHRALSESRLLGAAPDSRVGDARRRLHVPVDARLTIASARQIALGEGIRAVVAGSLTSFGGSYALSIKLISASTGDVLATAERAGIAPDKLIGALDTLSRKLRERAGDDLDVIRAQPSLLALTSASLEAMSDYVRARRASDDRAVDLLREAVALDPSFASALWQLSDRLARTGRARDDERRSLLARAYAHRDGLTEYERDRVEIAYLYSANGMSPDPVRLAERLRQIAEKYPNYEDAFTLANFYLGKRQLAAAESTYRLAIGLDSTRFDGHFGLYNTLVKQRRIPEARRTLDALARRFPDEAYLPVSDAVQSYLEGRRGRARELFETATDASTDRVAGWAFFGLAMLDMTEGRVANSRRDLRMGDSIYAAAGRIPGFPSLLESAAYWVGSGSEEGLRRLDSTLAADPAKRRNLDAAVLYAQLGKPDEARAVVAADDAAATGQAMRRPRRALVEGWIQLAEGQPREAIREFRKSQALSAREGAHAFATNMEPDLGLAFERAGTPDSAIAVYEHYLNDSVNGMDDHFAKLAWTLEHVAALYEKRGDRAKAKRAYARFVELWQHADPDLQPRVARASQRVAELTPKALFWWIAVRESLRANLS